MHFSDFRSQPKLNDLHPGAVITEKCVPLYEHVLSSGTSNTNLGKVFSAIPTSTDSKTASVLPISVYGRSTDSRPKRSAGRRRAVFKSVDPGIPPNIITRLV